MRDARICIFIISLLLFSFQGFAQDTQGSQEEEEWQQYGIRVGVDISKPILGFFDDTYRGIELLGDYRITEDYYAAVELGNESFLYDTPVLRVKTSGSYIKAGANYNVYNNKKGMQNSIYVGLRYGFATFSETLESYRVYTRNPYFEPDIRHPNKEVTGLTASWMEFQVGLKVEIVNNLYLGVHVGLKYRVNEKGPSDFDIVHIPGFNKTYDDSNFGVGWGYTVSYLIPFYEK